MYAGVQLTINSSGHFSLTRFFPDTSMTFSKIPDISLTAVKFPDISRFSRQLDTLTITLNDEAIRSQTGVDVMYWEQQIHSHLNPWRIRWQRCLRSILPQCLRQQVDVSMRIIELFKMSWKTEQRQRRDTRVRYWGRITSRKTALTALQPRWHCQSGCPHFFNTDFLRLFHDHRLRKSITYQHWIRDFCGLSLTVCDCQQQKIGCLLKVIVSCRRLNA